MTLGIVISKTNPAKEKVQCQLFNMPPPSYVCEVLW